MIVIKTQIGTGGKWSTVASLNNGPRNLLKASKLLSAEITENRGVGGYRSVLEIDGHVIGQENIGSDLDQAAAARIVADPAAYTPYQPD